MKKASLQLGISTIVVLVIAMVLIAGGIAFIRGFLNQGTDTLQQAFAITEFTIQPDSQTPLVFAEGDEITIKRGERITKKIGLFNKENTKQTFQLGIGECRSASGDNDQRKPTITYLPKEIDTGDGIVFNIFITADDPVGDLPADDYLCVLNAWYQPNNNYASVDAVISVYN